ncbi:MAG: 3'(2'),5'-bisphosphate nucleotidase CysQ [Nanoarchaeota archaeon]
MNSDFSLTANQIEFLGATIKHAGSLLLKNYKNPKGIELKEDNTLVSTADKESSSYIFQRLKSNFPSYGLIDEERKKSQNYLEKKYCWVIDPLDGTREYLKNNTNFGIIIGLLHKNNPIFGMTYRPIPNELIYAQKGKKAYEGSNKNKIGVKQSKEIDVLVTSSRMDEELKQILQKLSPKKITSVGSSFKIIDVAQGKATLFIQPPGHTMHLWDLCGTSVILHEAGGKITDWRGRPLSFFTDSFAHEGGIIASNGLIHERVVSLLSNVSRF